LSSSGQAAGVNPKNWKIIDGKLYLGWSREGMNTFAENSKINISKADNAWKKLEKE